MKISILTISDLTYEANLHRKIGTLKEAGYEVGMLAVRGKQFDARRWPEVDIHFISLPKRPTALKFLIYFVRSFIWVLGQQADLFISYDVYPLLALRAGCFYKRVSYIYDSVELFLDINALTGRPWRRRFWALFEKFGVGRAKAAFTVCHSDAEHLQKRYPFLQVAGFVRNIPQPSGPGDADFLRRTLHVARAMKIAVYQGMIFEGRGLREVIQALAGIENLLLVLIGEGPLKPQLEQLTEQNQVRDRVVFLDAVPFYELYKYTYGADIGLTLISGNGLSYYHALPNKLFEYIQAGLPVIGSNYPEIARIIDGERIGLSVDPRNIAAIHRALKAMLDENRYQRFKERLNRIKNKYTWEQEKVKYLRIIDKVLTAEKDTAK